MHINLFVGKFHILNLDNKQCNAIENDHFLKYIIGCPTGINIGTDAISPIFKS